MCKCDNGQQGCPSSYTMNDADLINRNANCTTVLAKKVNKLCKNSKSCKQCNKLKKKVNNLEQRLGDLENIIATMYSNDKGLFSGASGSNSRTRGINNGRGIMQTVPTRIAYRLEGDKEGEYRKGFKHYVINSETGKPMKGHEKAIAGFTTFFTDTICGNTLDVTKFIEEPIIL